jgi:hypothetical protein
MVHTVRIEINLFLVESNLGPTLLADRDNPTIFVGQYMPLDELPMDLFDMGNVGFAVFSSKITDITSIVQHGNLQN